MAKDNQSETNTLTGNTKLFLPVLLTSIFLVMVFSITWIGVERILEHERIQSRDSMLTVLQTTQESLHIWVQQRTQEINGIASSGVLRVLTANLLKQPPNLLDLKESKELKQLRTHISPYLDAHGDQGFFIISPNRLSIASLRDSNLGSRNLIDEQRGDLLDRVFAGEALFVPTLKSDVQLFRYQSKDSDETPTAFIAVPIRGLNHKIIAVLAVRIDVGGHFTQITQIGRLGESGETYAFDQNAILMTNSRFDDQLRDIGILGPTDDAIMSVRIVDPGTNMFLKNNSQIDRDSLPFTRMSESAINKESGTDVNGYRDYRGVTVYGAWTWDEVLGLGVATEIDKKEALMTFYIVRTTMFTILSITLASSLLLLLFISKLQKKSERELRQSHTLLEQRVNARTSELQEIQEKLIEANRGLEVLATTDALTGLPNRRQFDLHLESEWDRCLRENHSLTVIIFDVDYFKPFNDYYGHQLGDLCLSKIAEYLMSEKVSKRPGDLIARYGGEEFIVVLSNSNLPGAFAVAERIRQGIAELAITHIKSRVEGLSHVTVSIGGSSCEPNRNIGYMELVREADMALYHAKHGGRNQTKWFSEEMGQKSVADISA